MDGINEVNDMNELNDTDGVKKTRLEKQVEKYEKELADSGRMRTPIPVTCGQHSGNIRTAFRKYADRIPI